MHMISMELQQVSPTVPSLFKVQTLLGVSGLKQLIQLNELDTLIQWNELDSLDIHIY